MQIQSNPREQFFFSKKFNEFFLTTTTSRSHPRMKKIKGKILENFFFFLNFDKTFKKCVM